MAMTEYGVNHALAVKLWSRKLFQDALKKTYAARFMSKGKDSIITIQPETSKGPGDQVTVGVRMQLSGDGVQGDGTLEGNEEALTTYNDAVIINQLRHAVRSKGKMSEQRVPFSVREESKAGLEDWWSERIDTWLFNQLCGYTAQNDTRYTGNQATLAPSTDHKVFATGSADETQASTNVFNLNLIDKCIELADTLSPTMRPLKINGEDKFVMFLHPYQVYDLRTNTSTGQWLDIQKAAAAGRSDSQNPIYSGALGEYNGVVLHKTNRVTQGVNSSTGAAITTVRRAVFCGAQAALMAYGQKDQDGEMTWVEELFDYGNSLGVSAGMIAGLKKTRFNSLDFGTVTVSTYAAAH
jgi:N4-gp56 family major capsid protein